MYIIVYTNAITVEWDKQKNQQNILKHGIDFYDAAELFKRPMLREIDNRKEYGEERWIGIGLLQEAVVVTIYTLRSDVIRIISVRRASYYEREIYWKAIKN